MFFGVKVQPRLQTAVRSWKVCLLFKAVLLVLQEKLSASSTLINPFNCHRWLSLGVWMWVSGAPGSSSLSAPCLLLCAWSSVIFQQVGLKTVIKSPSPSSSSSSSSSPGCSDTADHLPSSHPHPFSRLPPDFTFKLLTVPVHLFVSNPVHRGVFSLPPLGHRHVLQTRGHLVLAFGHDLTRLN